MNRVFLLLLIAALTGCATRAPRAVPLAEARVQTAAEAQAIALRWVAQDSSLVGQLRLEEVAVQEQPAGWQVFIRRNDHRKPADALIWVDKRTGRLVRVPLR